jgi:hypothetical protein
MNWLGYEDAAHAAGIVQVCEEIRQKAAPEKVKLFATVGLLRLENMWAESERGSALINSLPV